MINPYICNIALDANALDENNASNEEPVTRFKKLCAEGKFSVVIPGGVRREVSHTNTPQGVKSAMLPQIYNLQPNLNSSQICMRDKVYAIMTGNSKSGRHDADANHVCEAHETGCGYFITNDQRILGKEAELANIGVIPTICTLRDFLYILEDFQPKAE